MKSKEILAIASNHLISLEGKIIPVLEVAKPFDLEYARHLGKTVSKLSPLVGNMIEYSVCEELNKLEWEGLGTWERQDPGFPDTIFKGDIKPTPGIEIKTWFPLATEITARFKDSIKFFDSDQTNVALVAWLPEFIIYGKPKIIGVWIGSAKELAITRDDHYHNPPDYLVFEPEDTSSRTSNLQQTNTNGYKFQGDSESFKVAEREVTNWGPNGKKFTLENDYQSKLKDLLGKYRYRLDTNFAKIDRIQHTELEKFKKKVLNHSIFGHTVIEWGKLVSDSGNDINKLLEDII